MRVQMVTIMAGPEGVVQPGTVLELPTPQAQRLIQAGAAVQVDAATARVTPSPPAAESAAVSPPETPEQRKRPGPGAGALGAPKREG